MAHRDRSEEVGLLRDAIARIEEGGQSSAPANLRPPGAVSLGPAAEGATNGDATTELDRAFPGGLRRGALHEVVAASAGDAPAACGFALALAARFAAALGRRRGAIVWIVEDHAKSETGAPYAPGLALYGIDPARLVVVEAASGQDSLWAAEEALKCRGLAAVVVEVWRLKPYDLAASRRLVLAAGKSGTPGLLVPAGAAGSAANLSSAARTRFEVRATRGRHVASAGGRTPLPGLAAWEVRLARIRAGPHASPLALDSDRFCPILWDHEEAVFRNALPLPVSPPARDRSGLPHPVESTAGPELRRA